ncbi:HEAT repeat family protein [Tritrichomonas foetus]|uniref:HEAT repeat family protein n=1 Tax=Tritrichomonas foetus TaxID=1144522 RepID=A0A1J4JGK5_9EUKA|nr:HEAT repeat family protein [Tritrichomonas foetus]|eukprot:OHS98288.1 HEAT repeat family protein [Tritrichomonas foetus]
MSSNQISEDLSNEDVSKRIEAVNNFSNVPPEQREALFRRVTEDFNHEVREAAANKIYLCPHMYTKFLADPDPQVRIAIINNSVLIRETQKESVLTALTSIVNDSVAEVRCALARVLYRHAEVKSDSDDNKSIVLANIVPLVDKLLGDRHDDVRVAASLNIKQLTIQFGFDFVFEQLYNSLHHMLTDTQWRVRNNAVELLFGLALVCSAEFFDQNLFPFLNQFLKDPCNKVRQFALSALPTLASHFGDEWLKTKLIDNLQELAQSQNFLHRETYLLCISELAGFFPVQYQSNYVFQPMIRMLRDPVQNVVLLAIELLSKHRESIHPFRRQYELKPILESLDENSPPTTKERASLFLAQCQ